MVLLRRMTTGIHIIYTVFLAILCSDGIALADATAYIANSGAGEVLRVVDDSDAITTMAVDDGPYGVAVTPDGDQVLVTQHDGNALVFIDTDDFSEAAYTLPVGQSPRGVAIDPDGIYAYVANFADDTVSKVSISGRRIVKTIEVGDGPFGLAVREDKESGDPVVYVANFYSDTVTVIDQDEETEEIPVRDAPVGVAVNTDGTRVYVANSGSDSVSIIDTETDTVVKTMGVGDLPWGIAVGDAGDYAYVANSASDTVTVIQTSNNTIVRTFSVGDLPRGVAAARYGTFAYVVNQGSGSIHRIDMEDRSVTEYAAGQLDEAMSIGAFIGDTPPSAPSGLSAETYKSNGIRLNWQDNSTDEVGFKIERRKENQDDYVQVATVKADTTTYDDHNLASNTLYYYRLRAYNEASDSAYSSSASARTARFSASVDCFIGTMMY